MYLKPFATLIAFGLFIVVVLLVQHPQAIHEVLNFVQDPHLPALTLR